MSVLETFYILFKSDSSDVKKGADEAEKSAKKLDNTLKDVGRDSERAGHSFLNLMRSASGALGAIVSTGAVFAGLKNAVASVKEIGDVSRELNVNVEALDAWGHAVQRTGGTAAQFQSSLKSLAEHFNTTPAVAMKSLPTLADALSRMNQATANAYGKSLGLDQSTIYLLQQGRRELEATIQKQKELGLVTKQDVEITRRFDNALYDLGRVIQGFSREAALPALPLLTKSFNYLIEHKDLIKGALIAIGGAVGIMGVAFAIANPEIAALAASLAAFSLAYEDWQKFKAGAPSVTGMAVDKFKKDSKGIELLLQHVAPSWLSDQSLDNFSNKYMHLPKFLGGQGYGGTANNTVNVGDVTIQTQATDGKEVAGSFTSWLDDLWKANSHFDSGVKI